jgi:hypothetical protein
MNRRDFSQSRSHFWVVGRNVGIHACLVVFFALCWFTQQLALLRMDMCNRQFLVMDAGVTRNMALIDLVSSHAWVVFAYVVLVFSAVLFMQCRRYPTWSWWVTAIALSCPLAIYLDVCLYIQNKFIF